ncbi:MAG TPA: UbiA family prenyltransferase [Bryobacteraceae bacterium]|nr:UbiA family prenyltransferase [Bryobacteraceae bacterium]
MGVISDKQPAASTAASGASDQTPLFVDLDGTLLLTDTLAEMAVHFVRTHLWKAPLLLFWLMRGRAYLKSRLAECWTPDPANLPVNEDLLGYLANERRSGRNLILATASPERVARSIADYLGIFSSVLATSETVNLKGSRKAAAIRSLAGEKFLYAGNSSTDFAIWHESAGAVLAGAPRHFAGRLKKDSIAVLAEFPRPRRKLWRILRAHQWVKNVLIFLPIATSHRFFEAAVLSTALTAFAAFSLAASAIYIVNDILDVESDRKHPHKRFRPFASGSVPLAWGAAAAVCLVLLSAGLSLALPVNARWLLATYLAGTMAYSLKLKRMLFADVLALATFYTMRVLFGGAATGIEISSWTLAFFMFVFLSLAMTKRLSELRVKSATQDTDMLPGRGYQVVDIPQVTGLAAASSYASVVVFALYINSAEAIALYHHPQRLWLICPFLIYWLSRFLLISNRGTLHHDPIVFATRDRVSYLVAFCVAVIVLISI